MLAFRQMRERALLECTTEERTITSGCLKCAQYQIGSWSNNDLIRYINLSMYPAPCQCRCLYCNISAADRDPAAIGGEGVEDAYEMLFDALDFALRTGMIAPNALWQVSSGEIAIHPYKERIFNLVRDQAAIFHTNCFRFDYQIAANLAMNPNSLINLSIDSGTRETWHRIKGFDNFGKILENLCKYAENMSRPNQISLKYIILTGINDGHGDFNGVISLMKALGIVHLSLACDASKKYTYGAEEEEETEKLAAATGHFICLLLKNKLQMSFDTYSFPPRLKEMAIAYAARGLKLFS
jgi:wyosine [tRNA(Phe)-imidazoG37] synthetase (radical SAM superfamily)